MEHITKRFGDFTANRDVTFCVRQGEVHALLGENGAGKSTLMNILSGLYQSTEGEIYINGKKVSIQTPQDARALGIGMVYQHFMLIPAMTVTENVMLSMSGLGPVLDFEATRAKIRSLSEQYHLEVNPDRYVRDLSVGEQQRIEIIKVLCANASILIFDEPTAVLTPAESEGLFEIMRLLIQEGHTIIFISHKLKEIMAICDRITVLRGGEKVCVVDKNSTTVEDLGNYMVGHKVALDRYPGREHQEETHLLELEGVVYSEQGVQKLNIDHLHVKAGEILGIAGVDGNGQSELAKAATGLIALDQGQIQVAGQTVTGKGAKAFIQAGVTHIPEDRNRMGLVGSMTLYENLVLKQIGEAPFSSLHGGHINYKVLHHHAKEMIQKYDIRTASENLPTSALSGGNQQKVIVAREMELGGKLIVAVHPTRGVDIGASDYIHQQLIAARDRGCAVLLISADLDEILRLSDRMAVIYEGQIMGYEDPENPDINRISLMMAGKEGPAHA
ncbi:MAG: ABC transporter ATP-binding protein [Oscillospiraceae bacterium]|nr:ABC transporter ATP-binding protein [Oscillospiraceae bacterium]